jgi:glucoamylase
MIIAIAPGGPGSRPTWTSSAKDMVTTALGTSRVWVTLGYGILNEVYWPATGLPQIRDLGFIVAGSSEWFEVKRVNRYHVSMPDDWVPLPRAAFAGARIGTGQTHRGRNAPGLGPRGVSETFARTTGKATDRTVE